MYLLSSLFIETSPIYHFHKIWKKNSNYKQTNKENCETKKINWITFNFEMCDILILIARRKKITFLFIA